MDSIFAWILASVVPWVKKALSGLGMGILTFFGVDGAFTQARDAVIARYGELGGTVAQMLSLFGFNDFIGIVLGAMAFALSIMILKRWGFLAE